MTMTHRHPLFTLIAIVSLMLFATTPSVWAGSASWNNTSDGTWNSDSNWNPATGYPQNQGETATFGSAGFTGTSEEREVTIDTAVTVGSLIFQASGVNNGYRISGPESLTLDVASGSATITATLSGANPHEIDANILIADPLNFSGGNFSSLIINGSMSGTVLNPNVTINKLDISSPTWKGNNNFGNGTVNLNSGTINLSTDAVGPNTIGGGSNTTIHLNGGTLTLLGVGTASNGSSAGVNSFQTNVQVDAATATLNSGRSNSGYGNEVNEIGSLTVKAGNTLNANNSSGLGYALGISGDLTLEAGSTLNWIRSSGFTFDGGHLQIRSGGTLRGTGTINTVDAGGISDEIQILSGGTVAPGFSTGILTVGVATADPPTKLVFSSGSTLEFELDGTITGSEYDQINLTGELTLGGATLDIELGYQAAISDKIFIILNDDTDPVTGIFDSLIEGATVDLGLFNGAPATARISYLGDSVSGLIGSGNDVVLFDFDVAGPVPEPSTLSLLALGVFFACRRRRTRQA